MYSGVASGFVWSRVTDSEPVLPLSSPPCRASYRSSWVRGLPARVLHLRVVNQLTVENRRCRLQLTAPAPVVRLLPTQPQPPTR